METESIRRVKTDSVLEEALRRAQGGDPDAYSQVVEATQARLRNFIAGYVPRSEWVDDIAQQSFVSAYGILTKFRLGTDFYAWLRQIAYNHLRAELERSSRRHRLERERLDCIAGEELTRRLDRDEGLDEELIAALRQCVSTLPSHSKNLLQSYYGDALRLVDIGRKLGRTADSLKVTLFKIRARLKKCVERKRVALETGN